MFPGASQVEAVAKDVAKTLIIDQLKKVLTYIMNYNNNLKQLQQKHGAMCNKELDISRQVEINESMKLERITAEAEAWLRSVGELREDEELKELMDDKFIRDMDHCCFGIVACNLYHRYKMSRTAQIKARDINEIVSHPPPQPLTLPVSKSELPPVPHDYLEGLESREKLLEKILENLQDEEVDAVGLFGMGAIGKTTLAREIANNRARNMFDEIVMVEISESPNIEHIRHQIAAELDLSVSVVTPEILYNRLKQGESNRRGAKKQGHKLLVILDNIWEKLDLRKVGIPHETTGEFTCKILLTSRKKDVCKVMGALEASIYEVGSLDDEESRLLFRKRFEGEIESEEYKQVEDRLLKKCAGLPLAIVTLANTLREKSLSELQHVADELEKPISTQVAGEHREIYSILETSYKHMDREEKRRFFLFASLFPRGSNIPIEDLMRFAIGFDLIRHVNSLSESMEVASRWAQELMSSSLLLEGSSKGQVKIHDTVREFAIAAKDDHMFLVESIPQWLQQKACKKYTTIALMSGSDHACLDGMKSKNLQMLLLRGSQPSKVTDTFFQGMSKLEVLVLSDMYFGKSLPKSISRLRNLRTLHLERCTELGDIGLIAELKNLVVLSLRDSDLEELPDGIRNLCNIRVLDLNNCLRLKRIPAKVIGSLSQLEGLYLYDSFDGWQAMISNNNSDTNIETSNLLGGTVGVSSIAELVSLPYLNVLEMNVPNIEQIPIDNVLPTADDQLFRYLNKFRISIGGTPTKVEKEVILLNSRILVLQGLPVSSLWEYKCLKGWLANTEWLKLDDIRGFKSFVPDLVLEAAGFTDLKSLQVKGCKDMYSLISTRNKAVSDKQCRPYDNVKIPFPNLEILDLFKLSKLKTICEGQAPPRMLSNLRELYLHSLPKLQPYVLPVELAHTLTLLDIKACEKLKFIFKKERTASVQFDGEAQLRKEADDDTIHVLPNLKVLDVDSLPRLQSILLDSAKCSSIANAKDSQVCSTLFHSKIIFPSLEKLEMTRIEGIKKLWDMPKANGVEICTSTAQASKEEHRDCSNRELYIRSFCNLKHIQIYSCDQMESLGSPSVVAALVQLESLSIASCPRMKEVIMIESDDEELEIAPKIIAFPHLKSLKLIWLDHLKWFYGGSYQLQFPTLEKLELWNLRRMSTFAGPEHSAAFFHEKIEFPCLRELKIRGVRRRVEEIWDAAGIELGGGGAVTTSATTAMSCPAPVLRKLKVSHIEGQIPTTISQNLSYLELRRCHNVRVLLVSVYSELAAKGEGYLLVFPQRSKMDELVISECDSLEMLFENQAAVAFSDEDIIVEEEEDVQYLFGQLKRLELEKLPKLKHMVRNWHLLKNLRKLKLRDVNWKYAFVLADLIASHSSGGRAQQQALPLLESIEIHSCDEMIAVIGEDEDEVGGRGNDEEEDHNHVIVFPRLKRLILWGLRKARNFVISSTVEQCRYAAILFPALEQLEIEYCDEIRSFLSSERRFIAPKLSQLKLKKCPQMQAFISGGPDVGRRLDLPSLQTVEITNCPNMDSFSSVPLRAPKLSSVKVDDNFMAQGDDINKALPTLKESPDKEIERSNRRKQRRNKEGSRR